MTDIKISTTSSGYTLNIDPDELPPAMITAIESAAQAIADHVCAPVTITLSIS